jgi:hypothetical protein
MAAQILKLLSKLHLLEVKNIQNSVQIHSAIANWRNIISHAQKIDSEQNFTIFSDPESVLKGNTNTSALNSTLHVVLTLTDNMVVKNLGTLWI